VERERERERYVDARYKITLSEAHNLNVSLPPTRLYLPVSTTSQ
jgi:hypothetical protein